MKMGDTNNTNSGSSSGEVNLPEPNTGQIIIKG